MNRRAEAIGTGPLSILAAVGVALMLAGCGYSRPDSTLYDWNLKSDQGAGDHPTISRADRESEADSRDRSAAYVPMSKHHDDVAVSALPAPASAIAFAWPVQGRILSAFGARSNGEQNDGVNIASDYGIPIHAAAAGTVTYAGNELKGYGNLVLIRHDDGYVTAYAHAQNLVVTRGEAVKQGQVIGYVGDTGGVPEPQLHFEIRRGKVPVDPLILLGSQSARS